MLIVIYFVSLHCLILLKIDMYLVHNITLMENILIILIFFYDIGNL